MPVKLSTTVSKIEILSNNINSKLISELYEYMKKNDLSESHINNTNLGNQKKNSSLSNEFMIYNLPIDEDITKCRDIVNNFLLDKCTNFDNQNVASLGYTVRRQRRLQLILKCLLIVGAIGWGTPLEYFMMKNLTMKYYY